MEESGNQEFRLGGRVRKVENGEWKVENGEWKMESGKWKVES